MPDKYLMDGNKLLWHLDRVNAWQRGEKIPPIHVDVGLNKGCNIKCRFCFGILQGDYDKTHIKFPREPLMQYMRDAGKIGIRSMAIVGEGEPLLNPAVYDAIVEGKKAGVDMALATNGLLFHRDGDGEKALEHLTWIRFNLNGATPKKYAWIHGTKESNFEKVLKVIDFCRNIKERRNLNLTIGLQMVLMPEYIDQVRPVAKLGKKLGVDYFVIKQCSDTTDSDIGIYNRLHHYRKFKDILEEAESISCKSTGYDVIVKWHYIMDEGKRDYKQCLGTPFLTYSSSDGMMFPCGMFFCIGKGRSDLDEYMLCDMKKQSLVEAYESDRWTEIHNKMKKWNLKQCYSNCKTHSINEFVWRVKNPPDHVNFP